MQRLYRRQRKGEESAHWGGSNGLRFLEIVWGCFAVTFSHLEKCLINATGNDSANNWSDPVNLKKHSTRWVPFPRHPLNCDSPNDIPRCSWRVPVRKSVLDSCWRQYIESNASPQRIFDYFESNRLSTHKLTAAKWPAVIDNPMANGADPLTSLRRSSQTPWTTNTKMNVINAGKGKSKINIRYLIELKYNNNCLVWYCLCEPSMRTPWIGSNDAFNLVLPRLPFKMILGVMNWNRNEFVWLKRNL